MSPSSNPIIELHHQGFSAREISIQAGVSRNAILGIIWRYKQRGGHVPQRKSRPDDATIRAAMTQHDGNLSAAARSLGVHPQTIRSAGFTTGRVRRNLSRDPATRAALDAIVASGHSDSWVTRRVGLGGGTLRNWRAGGKGSPFLVQCVMDAVK